MYTAMGAILAELSRFYGIVIWLIGGDHNPPHIHARYSGDEGSFDVATAKQTVGNLSGKAVLLVCEWIEIHRDELLEMWETQEFHKVAPLK
jgi:hypothetical protein